MQEPRITTAQELRLIGMKRTMSLASDQTPALWQSFMPRLREIAQRTNLDLYSVQCYEGGLNVASFSPQTVFEKWAAAAVSPDAVVPDAMELLTIPAGQYAVFIHHGLPSAFPQTAQHIYGTWLPNSGYQLDDRPHFEIMGPDYRPDDPQAQEEVWIPIRQS